MPNPHFNPDEIYHKASSGRLQNTDSKADSYDQIHIISANVEGSKEYEREKQLWREEKSLRLQNGLAFHIVFFTIAIAMLAFSNKLYGSFLPIIQYILYIVAGAFIVYILFYSIYQLKIHHDSRKYKKQQKNPPQNS